MIKRATLYIWFLANFALFPIFYDAANFNGYIYSSSLIILHLNPYSSGSDIVAGYPFLLFNFAGYWSFTISNENPYLMAITLKAILLFFTLTSFKILESMKNHQGLRIPDVILLAFLFNPFILFVNNIWVETDSIVIFFILAGLHFLQKVDANTQKLRNLVVGSVPLALAVFSYYYVLLLLPTLIAFRKFKRDRILLFIILIAEGGLFSLPMLLFRATSQAVFDETSNIIVNWYSFLNLFPSLNSLALYPLKTIFLLLMLSTSVIVPFVLRHIRLTESFSLLIVLSIVFLLEFSSIQGDNFVLLIPLILLVLSDVTISQKARPILVAASQLFLIPVFVIIFLFNGASGISGLFYWTYETFHYSLSLYSILGGHPFWMIMLELYLVLFSVTLLALGAALKAAGVVPTRSEEHRKKNMVFLHYSRRAITTVAIALIVVLSSVSLIESAPKEVKISNGAMLSSFYPLDYAGRSYELSSASTYTLNLDNGTLAFPADGGGIGLYRNLTNQSLQLSGEIKASNYNSLPPGSSVALLNLSGLSINFGNVVIEPYARLIPSISSSAFSYGPGDPSVEFSNFSYIVQMGTLLNYTFPNGTLSSSLVLFGGLRLFNAGEANVSVLRIAWNGTSIDSFVHGGDLVVTYSHLGSNLNRSTVIANPSSTWSLIEIQIYHSGLVTVSVGNSSVSLQSDIISARDFYVQIGYQNTTINWPKADLQITPLFKASNLSTSKLFYLSSPENGTKYYHNIEHMASFEVYSSDTIANVTVGTLSESFQKTLPKSIWIGKLNVANVALDFTFNKAVVSTIQTEWGFSIILIFFSIVLPTAIIVVTTIRKEKK